MPEDILSQDVEAFDANDEQHGLAGGKKRRKSSRRTRGRKGFHKRSMKKRKGTKRKGTKRKGHKKGPSKWIMHVKAYCRKTGKTFPEALKDPMCRKSFRH